MTSGNIEVIAIVAYVAIAIAGSLLIVKLMKDKTKKVSNLRLFIQIMAVFGIFFGLIIGPFGTPLMSPLGIAPRDRLIATDIFGVPIPDGPSVPVLGCYYASGRTVTCPIWQIQAYVFPLWNTGSGYFAYYTTSGIERLAIVFGMVIVMSLVLGRFFCGWICPFGLYMDLLTRARKAVGKPYRNFSKKTTNILSQLGYVIIAISLVISVIFGSQVIFGVELIPETSSFPHNMGEGGDVNSYLQAPFCLVCPMRPLCVLAEMGSGYMNPSYISDLLVNFSGPLYMFGWYITSLNLTVLILVTIAALAFRRFWCRICPLGALIALFSTFAPLKWIALTRLHKEEQKCTKCGICKRACPTQVTQMYEERGGDVTNSQCILCARCVEMCPYEGALKLTVAKKTVFKSRNWLKS